MERAQHVEPANGSPGRYHRWRHRRRIDRLPSRQTRRVRRAAAGARQADLRHDMACRRPGRYAVADQEHDAARRLFASTLSGAGSRDRPGNGIQAQRLGVACPDRSASGGTDPYRGNGARLRRRGRGRRPAGPGRTLPRHRHQRSGGRSASPQGRADESDRHYHGAHQGCPHERGDGTGGSDRHEDPDRR